MDRNPPLVSICCTAYNHERYIGETINGFINQKTAFSYEVIIHDDASTDRTAAIIQDFESSYPLLIKPIYQTENQYSRGVRVGQLTRAKATGKYIALCEGDDYWTDPEKLQRQVEYLEANPDCSLCVHATTVIDAITDQAVCLVRPSESSRIFSTNEIIRHGGAVFATNSMIYPRKHDKCMPSFFNNTSVGDFPLFLHLALNGTVFYIDRIMSSYRRNVPGSWTDRTFSDKDKSYDHYIKMVKLLDDVDKHTMWRFHDDIEFARRKYSYKVALKRGSLAEIKSPYYKNEYKELSLKSKLYLYVRHFTPSLHRHLQHLRRSFKNWRPRNS